MTPLWLALLLPWLALAADPPFRLDQAPPSLRRRIELVRDALQTEGYRIDEEAGVILSPATKQPISRPELEGLLQGAEAGNQLLVLRHFTRLLSDVDPKQPLPAEKAAELQRVIAAQPELLPESLREAISLAAKGPSATLIAESQASYTMLLRAYDGATSTLDLARYAAPPVIAWIRGERAQPYFDDLERRLGEQLQRQLAAHLAKNPVGREVLSELRGQRGDQPLPAVLVLKIDATAHDNAANNSIALGHRHVLDWLVARAPPPEREALRRALADPRRLARHLLERPELRAELIDAFDDAIAHELKHAAQDRRGRLTIEQLRGNAAENVPLERELEAFIAQNRYIHHKLRADPRAKLSPDSLEGYRMMLQDFEGWRSAIIESYLDNPLGSAVLLSTLAALQRERRREAERLEGGLWSGLRAWLRARGLSQGDAALREEEKYQKSFSERFRTQELPQLQREGLPLLQKILGRDEPGRALQLALAAEKLPSAPSIFDAARAAAAHAQTDRWANDARAWLHAGKGSREQRIAAAFAFEDYLLARKAPMPRDMYRVAVQERLRYLEHLRAGFARAAGGAEGERLRAEIERWEKGFAKWNLDDEPALAAQRDRLLGINRQKVAAP